MYTLTATQPKKAYEAKWIKDDGHYNHIPEPFESCNITEFWKHVGLSAPKAISYRQWRTPTNGSGIMRPGFVSLTIFWFHDQGFAVDPDTQQCWRLGCKHDMQHIEKLGNCHNRYKCTKCGLVEDIDSSD